MSNLNPSKTTSRTSDGIITTRYKNDQQMLHREDGPAVTDSVGTAEYWLDGTRMKKDEWEKRVKKK